MVSPSRAAYTSSWSFRLSPAAGRAGYRASCRCWVRKIPADDPKLAFGAKPAVLDQATLHRRVDELGRARGQGHVGDRLLPKEHEVACSGLFHLAAEHGLLIRVPRQGHPVQTVHLLNESRTVQT